jgi:exonuclease SbcD
MKILHTSDWHIGKKLGRHDRMDEHRAALAEVEQIADEREVDLVLVSGDLWDRAVPPMDALTLGLETLTRLGSKRPVVAVAGNHDSPPLFEALAPLLTPQGVWLTGAIKPPEAGGLIGPDQLGVPAVIARFPFLREGRVVDFMASTDRWYGDYAARVAAITERYNEALVAAAGSDAVPILMAHFLVGGVQVHRGAARGERELHMGEAYSATAAAIPPGPQYVAMGHIHAPQSVPGAPVPAEYAGSLLALDFGEAGEQKRVVIVDVEPGSLATIEPVPLTTGRTLVRANGTWAELEARADELAESFVDLTVRIDATDTTVAQRAAATFPLLVNVRTDRPDSPAADRLAREGLSIEERYVQYYRRERPDEDPPEELLALLRELREEVQDATA